MRTKKILILFTMVIKVQQKRKMHHSAFHHGFLFQTSTKDQFAPLKYCGVKSSSAKQGFLEILPEGLASFAL